MWMEIISILTRRYYVPVCPRCNHRVGYGAFYSRWYANMKDHFICFVCPEELEIVWADTVRLTHYPKVNLSEAEDWK